MKTTEERFFAKVNKTDYCWLWTASRFPNGYGQFSVKYRKVLAHRYAYELLVGPIPEGLDLDHLCRVRHCVNPAHLEPVTRSVNLLRGINFNGTKTHCKNGHPFDETNTYARKARKRGCRRCSREAKARWRLAHDSTEG